MKPIRCRNKHCRTSSVRFVQRLKESSSSTRGRASETNSEEGGGPRLAPEVHGPRLVAGRFNGEAMAGCSHGRESVVPSRVEVQVAKRRQKSHAVPFPRACVLGLCR